ncbi:3-oxo-5-alpha-steroid 4-dehydrogenase [Polystyrenella longa]|uniref:3-oxo-5-alpha-steroid 4-dehydrogenase n=1 Tax=Polystyrenella longa TaxID=2528007 RepID=A0A518CK69_9PLAN|nr:DUF1295 domain-containing protein [Polystyrenella longa]QDU79623.1 3-oxo-5-alpha-steroid 4-dehydrogenase [Polystyrenella longa]
MYLKVFLFNAIAIAVLMLLTWLVSLKKKDVSIVDIVWGLGFVLVGWVSWFMQPDKTLLQTGMIACLTIWGARLSGYLAWRKSGEGEDRRYGAMRTKHGDSFPLVSLLTVFILQGIVMWVVSLPLQFGLSSSGRVVEEGVRNSIFFTAILFWLTGFLFESIGDYQLARFKSDPDNEGKVFDQGLWSFTRHPNYFGDFLVWWGFGVMGLALSAELWSLIGPAVMSIFLLKISGVSLLERDLRERKPAYAKYVEQTNAFFPSPPKTD